MPYVRRTEQEIIALLRLWIGLNKDSSALQRKTGVDRKTIKSWYKKYIDRIEIPPPTPIVFTPLDGIDTDHYDWNTIKTNLLKQINNKISGMKNTKYLAETLRILVEVERLEKDIPGPTDSKNIFNTIMANIKKIEINNNKQDNQDNQDNGTESD